MNTPFHRALNALRGRIESALLLIFVAAGTPAVAMAGPRDYLERPAEWFASNEGRRVADNVLSHQSPTGSWPKNVETTEPFTGDRSALHGTFDNGATTGEVRLLARAYNATRREPYRDAVERAIDHILDAQYPTGGWPQFHPPGEGYHRHITFNDDAMVRLMTLLRNVATEDEFAFLDDGRRRAAGEAFDRGVDCILRTQVRVDGVRIAWCAQHDEVDLSPRPARSYELASLSGSETVGIVRLLMSLADPSPQVVETVESAVAWLEAVKLEGIRLERRDGDTFVVEDPSAPPMWARFYEIGTNRPIFADRDGVPKRTLAEIGHERRNGYAWLGTWPRALLERECPAWEARRRKPTPAP